MDERSLEERYREAQYKSDMHFYANEQRKKAMEAEQEPEQETDLQRMARAMGAPAPGYARDRGPAISMADEEDRKLRDAFHG